MVQGVAGAGKTTIMNATRHIWESTGLQVRGAAVAAVALKACVPRPVSPRHTLVPAPGRSGPGPAGGGGCVGVGRGRHDQ
ncbi:AAA family ATPase (plasmid) [Nocardiopsis flavescens]|nr:AAA family ATPase [Nocardiopsis flavescens]